MKKIFAYIPLVCNKYSLVLTHSKWCVINLSHEELYTNAGDIYPNYNTEYYSDSYKNSVNYFNLSMTKENALKLLNCNIPGLMEDVYKLMYCGKTDYAMHNAENYARFVKELYNESCYDFNFDS
ncbi:MAG: hypothetical protein MJZ34_00740 [Paludibacteraceae bacterium]|nr:hypothetical protein [Paludibacteraceae bacterium]